MALTPSSRILPQAFYERPVQDVARDLLGKRLVRRRPDGSLLEDVICETEAYDGPEDRACHAARGRTARTEVMFGPAGHWYVYFVYGMHWMLNIVTGPVGYPAAVLIRGVRQCSGPGRVTRRFGIEKQYNAQPATPAAGLWIGDGDALPEDAIRRTPRIGVASAGEWAAKPFRYVVESSAIL